MDILLNVFCFIAFNFIYCYKIPKVSINDKQVHEGKNVKRIREMLGIKQEALAFELGDDWNQINPKV